MRAKITIYFVALTLGTALVSAPAFAGERGVPSKYNYEFNGNYAFSV